MKKTGKNVDYWSAQKCWKCGSIFFLTGKGRMRYQLLSFNVQVEETKAPVTCGKAQQNDKSFWQNVSTCQLINIIPRNKLQAQMDSLSGQIHLKEETM